MKISKEILMAAAAAIVMSGCLDGGSTATGGGSNLPATNSIKNTKWNIAEVVVDQVFIISSTNAATENLGITFKATGYVLEEPAGDCSGSFTTDDNAVVDFKDATCTSNCCTTSIFTDTRTLLISGVVAYKYNTDKTTLTLKKDDANYILLKKP